MHCQHLRFHYELDFIFQNEIIKKCYKTYIKGDVNMYIGGLQKLSLLDYPGRICATIFTVGCNFKCPFCHNASLVLKDKEVVYIPQEEIFSFLEKRKGLLDGVCITGGEPLLQKDIINFIRYIKQDLGFLVKIDTNGSFPDKLKEIIDLGLVDYISMDIKNSLDKYPLTVGLDKLNIKEIEKSVEILRESNVPYEYRTTLVREFHTQEDLDLIAKWLKGAPRYYLQNFADSGDLIAENMHEFDKNEIIDFKNKINGYFGNVEIRGI